MLKRAQKLAKQIRESGPGDGSNKKRPSSASLSLKGSPITRLMSWHVGRGASSGMMQQVAQAAVDEAGGQHLTASHLGSCVTPFLSTNRFCERGKANLFRAPVYVVCYRCRYENAV